MVQKQTLSTDYHPPVTNDEIRAWCRIDDDQDEVLLSTLIQTATLYVEGLTGQSVAARLYEIEFEGTEGPRFLVDMPVITLVSVGLRDHNGVTTPLTSSEYTSKAKNASLTFWLNEVAVSADTSIVATVEVGYNTSADVPAPLRHAIAVFVGAHYADREGGDAIARAERTIAALVAPFRLSVL